MLDAALRRAEQVQRQTVQEAMLTEPEAAVPPPPIPEPEPKVDKPAPAPSVAPPVVVAPPAVVAPPRPEPVPPLPDMTASPTKEDETDEPKAPLVALETPPKPAAKLDPKVRKVELVKKETSPPPAQSSPAKGPPTAGESVDAAPSLEIADTRLCRRVISFGSVDPLPAKALKPGQVVVLYAELTGVDYDRQADEFRSRSASRLELFRGSSPVGNPVWVEIPKVVEDVCRHRRRDFYLNYLIPVPRGVEPGDYTLRLSVTDLVSNRSATSQVPLTIAR